jgi:Leucine-rich repeat (LRR) protein
MAMKLVLKVLSLTAFHLLFLAETREASKHLYCDNTGTQKELCLIGETTVIDKDDFEMSSNANFTYLIFTSNWKVAFLPIKVEKVFPALVYYLANGLLLTKVSKKNFEGLSLLKNLSLYANRIEEIQAGTFESLVSLKMLDLCK